MSYLDPQIRGLSPITALSTPVPQRIRPPKVENPLGKEAEFRGSQGINSHQAQPVRTSYPVLPKTTDRRSPLRSHSARSLDQPLLFPLGSPISTRNKSPEVSAFAAVLLTSAVHDLDDRSPPAPVYVRPLPLSLESRDIDAVDVNITRQYAQRCYPFHVDPNISDQRPDLNADATTLASRDDADNAGLAGIGAGGRDKLGGIRSRPTSVHASEPVSVNRRPVTYHGSSMAWESLVWEAASPSPSPVPAPTGAPLLTVSNSDFRSIERSNRFSYHRVIAMERVTSQSRLSRLRICHNQVHLYRWVMASRLSRHLWNPSPRSRTISDVILAFFKTDTSEAQSAEQWSRRLSKARSRKGHFAPSGIRSMPASRRASPPPKDEASDVRQPESAIRLSGAFGIRDDGSELFSEEQDVSPLIQYSRPWRPQNHLNNGSAQSLKTRRLLYVENSDEGVNSDAAAKKHRQYFRSDSRDTDRSIARPEAVHLDERYPRFNLRNATSMSLPNFSTNGISLRSSTHSENRLFVSVSGQDSVPDDTAASHFPSAATGDHHPVILQDVDTPHDLMVDKSVQTTVLSLAHPDHTSPLGIRTFNQTSPFSSVDSHARSRDSRHPYLQMSPLLTGPPLEPGSALPATTTAELHHLVASRLLSDQATALVQYSQATREISTTMQRVARESLEWAAHLVHLASLQHVSSSGPTLSDSMLSRSSSMPASTAFSIGTANMDRPDASDAHASLADLQYGGVPTGWLLEVEELGQQGWTNLHQAEDAWTTAMSFLKKVKMGDVGSTDFPGSVFGTEPALNHEQEQPISSSMFESDPALLSEMVAGKLEAPAQTPEPSQAGYLNSLDSPSVSPNSTMGVGFENKVASSNGSRLFKRHSAIRRVLKSPAPHLPSDKNTSNLNGRTKHWWWRSST